MNSLDPSPRLAGTGFLSQRVAMRNKAYAQQKVEETALIMSALKDKVRPPFASDEKRSQALALFKKGIGYTRASRILDMPANTLRDWQDAYKAGKFKTSVSPRLYRYTEGTKEKAIRMRLSGSTWNEITEQTGASATTCKRWVETYVRKPAKERRALFANGF